MPCLAREIVSFECDDDRSAGAARFIDYVGVSGLARTKMVDIQAKPTPSQNIRRRHRNWMILVDHGELYWQIAEDYGVDVATVYRGVERARQRERKIRGALERHAN